MAITKTVRRWTCIVPVRFARAPSADDPNVAGGPPAANAPDIDDRGFTAAPRGRLAAAVGFDEDQAEADRPEVRVRLIRQDIENSAVLHITSSETARIEITAPAGNVALANQQRMMVKFKAKAVGDADLEVRHGAADGPIIHRLAVTVQAMLDVRVSAHVPTITGAAINDSSGTPVPARSAIRTDANIRAMLASANDIYAPYGLRLVLDGAIDRAGTLACINRGMVNDQTAEFNQIMALNRTASAINIYFVPQIGAAHEVDRVGGSATSAIRNPGSYGLLIADMAGGGQTFAHEVGHVLNLVNDPTNRFIHVNTVRDPARPGTGRDIRSDMISRRRLMWAYTNLLANADMPYRDDVGYGAGQPGSMLAIKQFRSDRTDEEMQEVRRVAGEL